MKTADILIIEPSKDLADVLAKTFRQKGYSVALANSAQEGIEMADKTNPRIVILELIMPRHNGLEFIHEFRSYVEWMSVPIIIYSQLAPSDLGADDSMLASMGAAGHFYKPTTSLAQLMHATESIFESINI